MAEDDPRSTEATATTLTAAHSLKEVGTECFSLASLVCAVFSLKEPSAKLSKTEHKMIQHCDRFLDRLDEMRASIMEELEWIRRRCG